MSSPQINTRPPFSINTLQKVRSKFDILRYAFLCRAHGARGPASSGNSKLKKWYLRMSNFDLTFCKVYIYAKGWPGINLGAWHESWTHPIIKKNNLIIPYLTLPIPKGSGPDFGLSTRASSGFVSSFQILPGQPLAKIYTLQKVRSKFDIHRYGFLGRARCACSPAS